MANRLFALMAVAVAILSSVSSFAITNAHEIDGNHWASSPVDYHDITTNYSGNIVSRRWDFNDTVDNMEIAAGSSGADVQIADNAYGSTGWFGLCSGELWASSEMFIDYNDSYMLGYSGNKRSAAVAHEFGHCFGGVDHHETSGRIMQADIADFYDNDGVWGIDTGTEAEIDNLWN